MPQTWNNLAKQVRRRDPSDAGGVGSDGRKVNPNRTNPLKVGLSDRKKLFRRNSAISNVKNDKISLKLKNFQMFCYKLSFNL